MRHRARLAAVLALSLAPAAAVAQETYTLKVRALGAGDVVQTEMESRTRVGAVKLNQRGDKVLDHNTLTVGRIAFTDTILEAPAGAERTRRYYTRATVDSDGRESPQPFQGLTVLIVREGGTTAALTERGEPIGGPLGEQLTARDARPGDEVRWEDMLPRGPVRVGATWELDARRWARPEVEARGGSAVGRLARVYQQGQALCATVEFVVEIPLASMEVKGRRLPLQPGSRMTSRTIVDLCIDGTSSWRFERGTSVMVTHIHAPGGDGLDTRMSYEAEINSSSSCRPAN